jgi:hypothetical protein
MVNTPRRKMVATFLMALGLATVVNTVAHAQEKKPNIVILWGDDIGQFNLSAYNMGMMGYKTPNIDWKIVFMEQRGVVFILSILLRSKPERLS